LSPRYTFLSYRIVSYRSRCCQLPSLRNHTKFRKNSDLSFKIIQGSSILVPIESACATC